LTTDSCSIKGQGGMYLGDMTVKQIENLLLFRYPTVMKALRVAKKLKREVPFSREFSIDKGGLVRYKTKMVGEWTGRKFILLSRFPYMKELLKEYTDEYLRHM